MDDRDETSQFKTMAVYQNRRRGIYELYRRFRDRNSEVVGKSVVHATDESDQPASCYYSILTVSVVTG